MLTMRSLRTMLPRAMSYGALWLFLRSSLFIARLALLLTLAVPRKSAEFVVSTDSLLSGLALIAGAGLLAWLKRN